MFTLNYLQLIIKLYYKLKFRLFARSLFPVLFFGIVSSILFARALRQHRLLFHDLFSIQLAFFTAIPLIRLVLIYLLLNQGVQVQTLLMVPLAPSAQSAGVATHYPLSPRLSAPFNAVIPFRWSLVIIVI